jgi:type VI secretion system secreted protein Hcp
MTLSRLILRGSAVLGTLAGLLCFVHADAQAVEHLTLERAVPIYMKCDGLTRGHSSSQGTGWIQLQSFQWGVGRGVTSPRDPSSGGAADRESSRPSVSEIVITKRTDVASPLFSQAALHGRGDKCELHFDKANTSNAQPYMTINLENVMVARYSMSSGGDRPSESLTLNFTKIEYKNNVQTRTDNLTTSGKTILVPAGISHPSPSPSPVQPK